MVNIDRKIDMERKIKEISNKLNIRELLTLYLASEGYSVSKIAKLREVSYEAVHSTFRGISDKFNLGKFTCKKVKTQYRYRPEYMQKYHAKRRKMVKYIIANSDKDYTYTKIFKGWGAKKIKKVYNKIIKKSCTLNKNQNSITPPKVL